MTCGVWWWWRSTMKMDGKNDREMRFKTMRDIDMMEMVEMVEMVECSFDGEHAWTRIGWECWYDREREGANSPKASHYLLMAWQNCLMHNLQGTRAPTQWSIHTSKPWAQWVALDLTFSYILQMLGLAWISWIQWAWRFWACNWNKEIRARHAPLGKLDNFCQVRRWQLDRELWRSRQTRRNTLTRSRRLWVWDWTIWTCRSGQHGQRQVPKLSTKHTKHTKLPWSWTGSKHPRDDLPVLWLEN